MKVVTRLDWKRWVIGAYADSLTVTIFVGPVAIDFLYQWNATQKLFADGAEPINLATTPEFAIEEARRRSR